MSVPIGSLLARKGREVVTIPARTSLVAAARVLRAEEIGVVVATDDAGDPAGILSERDIVRAVAEHDADFGRLCVQDIMSRRIVSCGPDDTVRDAEDLMHTHYIRHLPVLSGGRLVGIISMRDVTEHRMQELRTATRNLRANLEKAGAA